MDLRAEVVGHPHEVAVVAVVEDDAMEGAVARVVVLGGGDEPVLGLLVVGRVALRGRRRLPDAGTGPLVFGVGGSQVLEEGVVGGGGESRGGGLEGLPGDEELFEPPAVEWGATR